MGEVIKFAKAKKALAKKAAATEAAANRAKFGRSKGQSILEKAQAAKIAADLDKAKRDDDKDR